MCEDRVLQGQEPHLTNLGISPLDQPVHPLILAQTMLPNKWKEMDKEPCFLRTIKALQRGKNNHLSKSVKVNS